MCIAKVKMNGARRLWLVVRPLFLIATLLAAPCFAQEGASGYSRTSIDIGLAVRDIDEAVNFYTKAIGFRETKGFTMTGDLARHIGLTEGAPLEIRTLVLAEDKSAARLKLIALADDETPARNNSVVEAEPGYRYITIFVADIDQAVKRIRESGYKAPRDGPIQLGDNVAHEVFVMLVRDPEGNLVELVGPRKGTQQIE